MCLWGIIWMEWVGARRLTLIAWTERRGAHRSPLSASCLWIDASSCFKRLPPRFPCVTDCACNCEPQQALPQIASLSDVIAASVSDSWTWCLSENFHSLRGGRGEGGGGGAEGGGRGRRGGGRREGGTGGGQTWVSLLVMSQKSMKAPGRCHFYVLRLSRPWNNELNKFLLFIK